MDAATHADLAGRLRGLLISLDDRLPTDTAAFVSELIDASEFGVGLETLADVLSEEATPITSQERSDFLTLVGRMEMDGRVARCLALCPDT